MAIEVETLQGHYRGAHTGDRAEQVRVRSLEVLHTPRRIRPLAVNLIVLIVLLIVGLIYLPWQQSVTGTGRVMVMSPMERPQNIEAQITGRIVQWNVQEGETVKAEQQIAELADIDSKFLDEAQVKRLTAQREAQIAKRTAALGRAEALEQQIGEMTRSRGVALPSAQEKAQQNDDKFIAAQQSVAAAKQSLTTAELNQARLRELHEKGLRSRRDLELADLDAVRARTELERSQAALEVARRETAIGKYDQVKIDADTSASLSALRAALASVRESVATADSDLIKLEIELQNVTARTAQRIVRAPRDGQIVRLLKVGAGTTVKAGDVLAVIAPTTIDQAVEVMLSDNDAPLVAVGRHVRLQFAGWPAVQFAGWPSIAVGTFGGRVAVVDAIDDGKSRYRVIITPDWEMIRSGKDEPWPSSQFLRPGAEATGWVMLDTVSLGFELWRQFNAFPPSVEQNPAEKSDGEKKLGKEIDYKPFF